MTTEKQVRELMGVISEQFKLISGGWEYLCEAYDISPKFGDKLQNIKKVKEKITELETLLQLILKETQTVSQNIDKLGEAK